ncbi:SDR family NAD(P)-dependent oxidoreductase, partial [Actinomadura adrarensis]
AIGGDARLVVGDLSSVRTVRETAERLGETCPRIDVLVHNAGLWPNRRVLNEDGLEQSFATNHIAPFLLNMLLEPVLLKSRTRVVQVSAGLYVRGKVELDRTPTGLDFHPIRTYCDTKLCNLMLVPLFAERWKDSGVAIDALHPGVIRTGLGSRDGGFTGLLLSVAKLPMKRPAAGGKPVVALALANDRGTGRYYHLTKQQRLARVATDTDLARRLWDHAAQHTEPS